MSNNYEINYWKLIFATHLATLRLETPDFIRSLIGHCQTELEVPNNGHTKDALWDIGKRSIGYDY